MTLQRQSVETGGEEGGREVVVSDLKWKVTGAVNSWRMLLGGTSCSALLSQNLWQDSFH